MTFPVEPAGRHHAERLGIALRQLSESPEEMILHRNTGRRLPAPPKQNAANEYDYHHQPINQSQNARPIADNWRVRGNRGNHQDLHVFVKYLFKGILEV